MWESDSESTRGRDYCNGVLSSSRHNVNNDGFERKNQSWYASSDIPSDILVHIGGVNFHLHKYPLLSRCGKMNRLVYDSRDQDIKNIDLDDLPGGLEAFELAAKFCYGVAVDLTAANISGLRCAAEYLEMTEDLEEGNLIFKTEAFLSYVVSSSWKDSILVLKSCEHLSPWAENLQIVRRSSESIAWKACTNPRSIRWAYTGRATGWNELTDSSPSRNQQVPSDWWFEDASILRIDHFVRVITAIKVKGMRFDLIGAAIMQYGAKRLPGFMKEEGNDEGSKSRDSSTTSSSWKSGLHMIVVGNKDEAVNTPITKEQRMIIESLISIIPPQKDSVSCNFLLRLLKMANMLKVSPALVTELEKRVGMQFEQADLPDLLIPTYNNTENLYDVDLVHRLLEHFLVQEQIEPSSPGRQSFSDRLSYDGIQRGSNASNAKMRVAKLLDSYLTEVARDRNLSLTKFQVLAEALPESARSCDDGLYRAVDSYLKAHPTLSEHERKRLCRVMDCQKLSIDACMHAAQNERLPLRVVVQVLFSEQIKISNAVANNAAKETGESFYQPMVPSRKALLEGTPQTFQEGWTTAKKDINTLKFELESMKAKYLELQYDIENLQRQVDKSSKPKHSSAWTSGWRKLGRLAKLSTLDEDQEIEPHQLSNNVVDEPRKVHPRRWRNSIS